MQPTAPSETSERIREAQRLWHETSFQRAVQQAAPRTTASDIPVVPLATPVDWPEDLYLSHLGFPGEAPIPWGPTHDVSWTIVDDAYFLRLWNCPGDQSTVQIFAGPGQWGLSVAFDLFGPVWVRR